MSYRVLTASVFLLALTASGCAKNDALVEVKGACADVFTGQVCTWAKVSGSAVVEAGGVIPIASIEHAPAQVPMAWPPVPAASIDMPDAVRQQTGLTQFTMDWEAGGHPPGGS